MNEAETVALVHAVSENAKRLGLTWELQTGTIVAYSPMRVTVDLAETPTPVTPLVTGLRVGDRVMVMAVPPAGQYVVGYANGVDSEPDWINYTPSWTSLTGTNPTPSNHNLTLSRYIWVNRNLICAEIAIIMGGAGFGTGVWAFGLPFAVNGTQISVGVAHGLDALVAEYPMTCKLANSTQIRAFATHTRGDVGPTVPFTWASTDVFTAQIHYRPV